LGFNVDAAVRWPKHQRRGRPVRRRQDAELTWVDGVPAMGSPILLDSSVYIDTLQGRSTAALDALITSRTCNHSTVCLAELTHAYGRLSPEDTRTAAALKIIGQTMRDIPAHRLIAPDANHWGSAGMLAGALFRLGVLRGRRRAQMSERRVVVLAGGARWADPCSQATLPTSTF
jgi:hypothetical protein